MRGAVRPLKLGSLMERHRRIEDALGSLKRHISPRSSDFLVTPLPPAGHKMTVNVLACSKLKISPHRPTHTRC
jgi:hypothetical protein